jgi:hypothetical protein
MALSTALVGLGGFLFCIAFQKRLDPLLYRSWRSISERLRRSYGRPEDGDLALISSLTASLRAGISLDSALELAAKGAESGTSENQRIRLVLLGQPPRDFLSSFLDGALRTGIPALSTLQMFQKLLRAERRVRTRAAALTSQSRAQAEILSWLPWTMAATLAALDAAWFAEAARQGGSWLCWSLAVGLLGLGRAWMRSLLAGALRPANEEERIREELLPELILRIVAEISTGKDAESALESSLLALGDRRLFLGFRENAPGSAIESLKRLILHAARTGAPVRDDLMAHMSELNSQRESRWEERVQRLPVLMLAPLFACFFPSCLLVMAALLLPLLGELL